MIIQCLVIKSYKGYTIARQREIVQQLGFVRNGVLWDKHVETVEEIRKVESALRGKVPYLKKR